MTSYLDNNLPVLQEYSTIINDALIPFVTLSRKIGGELSTMIDHVVRLFDAQQQFIQKAVQNKKPANDVEMQEWIKPQSTEIETICGKAKTL